MHNVVASLTNQIFTYLWICFIIQALFNPLDAWIVTTSYSFISFLNFCIAFRLSNINFSLWSLYYTILICLLLCIVGWHCMLLTFKSRLNIEVICIVPVGRLCKAI